MPTIAGASLSGLIVMVSRLDELAFEYIMSKMESALGEHIYVDYTPIFARMRVKYAQYRTEEENREIRQFAKEVVKIQLDEEEIGEYERSFIEEIIDYAL